MGHMIDHGLFLKTESEECHLLFIFYYKIKVIQEVFGFSGFAVGLV